MGHGKYGNDIDTMWEDVKDWMTGHTMNIDSRDSVGAKVADSFINIGMIPIGISSTIFLNGPLKGIQQVVRKLKLASEKRKLAKLEKQAA